MNQPNERTLDVVIAWVDGAVASIIKYVPFCRHIYIVTDQQKPAFIDEFAKQNICSADKIRIVDHKDIFRVTSSFYQHSIPDRLSR